MYCFKFYFNDGTSRLSDIKTDKVEKLYLGFEGFLDANILSELNEEDMTSQKLLKLAITSFKGFIKDFYRIEIINTETNDIIDFIQEDYKTIKSKNIYAFKFYYKDGTAEILGGNTEKPELLYYNFDGLLDWDEFYSLYDKKITTKDVLKIAFKIYKGFVKDFYRIEIINTETDEVIDYKEVIF